MRIQKMFTSNMLAAHDSAKTAKSAISKMHGGPRYVAASARATIRLPSGKLIPFKDSKKFKMATFAWDRMNFEERVRALKARKRILEFRKLRAELQRMP